jgi:predicted dehydrogenase
LRGAIIGFGNVAIHAHLPEWVSRRDVELVAAADVRPARQRECRARLPGAAWYDSATALLADADLDLDFVDICTPPSTHAAVICEALERGLHVLCEKPLVTSLEDLRAVSKLSRDTGRVLHTVHNWHHAPIVQRTSEFIAAGAIGRVSRAVWHTLRMRPASTAADGDNWRLDPRIAGGGILSDHGWHVCYILQSWIASAPTAVSATLQTRRHTAAPVEDTASLRLHFPDATADVLLTWAADERRNWAELTGDCGRIELHDHLLVLRQPGGEQRWPFASGLSDGSQHPEWFHPVAEQFLAAINGRADENTNLEEASLCVAVEALARESNRHGGATLTLPRTVTAASIRPGTAL